MGIKAISRSLAQSSLVTALGLNSELLNINTEEVIACSIRRVASFLSPCSPSALISAATEPLKGLIENLDIFRDSVEDSLESLVAFGDLLNIDYDVQDPRGYRGPTIFAAPPCFVRRRSGTLVLIGILPDNTTLLSEEMQKRIVYRKHIRLLPPDSTTQDAEILRDLGYIELLFDTWSKLPRVESPADFINRADQKLRAAPPAGSLGELEIVGPWVQELFYKRRWITPTKECGRYVGRRKHSYRADIWGYFELSDGKPIRFIDLPFDKRFYRGCDDAWRLQAALDHSHGIPQVYKIRERIDDNLIFDFFSPVPMWASRRWDLIGVPVPKENCLFSYAFSSKEAEEEMVFIEKYLWTKKV
jgi:hypothetical protein